MATSVRDVMEAMELLAPRWLAREGDPVGLHAGDPGRRVRRILVTMDATLSVVEEARRRKCQMIVSHHPRIYRRLATLDESTPGGALAAALLRGKLALFCAHTNLDAAPGGTNDALADAAGLDDASVVDVTARDGMRKLAVFVPESHLDAVRGALADAGAGEIGEYADCSFRVPGIGAFRGSDATNPHIGESGRYEEVEEWRLEVVLPASRRESVLAALRESHPYEEPAFDIYMLEQTVDYGCGRIGDVRRTETLAQLGARLATATNAPGARILGTGETELRRVAVWAGAGCPVDKLVALGAEAVVCGELSYHDGETLAQAGVGAVILGHAPSEALALPLLANNLAEALDGLECLLAETPMPEARSL